METDLAILNMCVRRSNTLLAIIATFVCIWGCSSEPTITTTDPSSLRKKESTSPHLLSTEKPSSGLPECEDHKAEIIRVQWTGDPLKDAYLLSVYSDEELVRIERSEPVYLAMLARKNLDPRRRVEALEGLSKLRQTSPLDEMVAGLVYVDEHAEEEDRSALDDIAEILLTIDAAALAQHRETLIALVEKASRPQTKQIAMAAIIVADGKTEDVWQFAQENNYTVDLLAGLPLVPSNELRAMLFEQAKSQLEEMLDDESRAACMAALASMQGREADVYAVLVNKVNDVEAGPTAVAALLSVNNKDAWPQDQLPSLGNTLIEVIMKMPEDKRNSRSGKTAIALARSVSAMAPADVKKHINGALADLVVPTIEIATIGKQMSYDKKVLVVSAGKPLQIVLKNHDEVPHNIVFIQTKDASDPHTMKPTMEKVALAAEVLVRMAGSGLAEYVPEIDEVIAASEMIAAEDQGEFTFTAPEETGTYPFICTFPGQWTKMYGAMIVVENDIAYLAANPTLPTAEKLLGMRGIVQQRKPEEVIAMLTNVKSGRSFDAGKKVFESTANCISCHRIRDRGGLAGPELTGVSKKYKPHEIAREMADPSKVINEKFALVRIVIDGRTYQGVIVDEDDEAWKIKPMEKLQVECEPIVIKKVDFQKDEDAFIKLTTSPMPDGQLNYLHDEEIKDLFAYILSGGDPEHAVFKQ